MKQRKGMAALRWTTVLVLLGASTKAFAQSDDLVDTLKGKNGESACTLKQNIYTGCQIEPFNSTFEKPASCTCNLEFFNIMSACTYSSFSSPSSSPPTLPIYSDWIRTCSASGINMDQSQILSNSDTWGVESPDWARLGVPANRTIDLQRAVILVESGPKPPPTWSTLQIILPIVTALASVLLTLLIASLLRRRSSSPSRSRSRSLGPAHSSPGIITRIQRMFNPKPVPRVSVKPMDRYDTDAWEIDDHGGKDYGYGYGTGKRAGTGDREMYQFSDIPNSAGVGVGAVGAGDNSDRDRERDRETIFTTPNTPYTDIEGGAPQSGSTILTSPPSIGTQARSVPPNGPGAYPFGPTSAPQTYAQRGQPQMLFKPERARGGDAGTQTHTREQSGSSFVGSIMNAIPNLPSLGGIATIGKKKPQKIVEVAPSRAFDINDVDHSSAGANRSTFPFSSAGHGGGGYGDGDGEEGEGRVFSPTTDLKSMDFHDSLERSRSIGMMGGAMSGESGVGMGSGRSGRMSADEESMGNPNSDIRVVSASTDSYYLPRGAGAGIGHFVEDSIPPQQPQPLSSQSSYSTSTSPSNSVLSNTQPFRSNSSDSQNPGRPKGVRPLPPSPQLHRQQSTASSMSMRSMGGASDIYADPFSDR